MVSFGTPGRGSSACAADFSHPSELADCCILIIDDDLTSQVLLEQMLLKHGFTNLHFAEDGQAGLDCLDQVAPDLVLLDLMMPNMDGYEFCRQVRALPEYASLPILVQTSREETQDRVETFAVGATDFVTKPLLAEELLARINIHLSNRVLIRQLSSYRRRVQAELGSARQMQHELIPSDQQIEQLAQRYSIDIAHFYQASSELGGDYYGLIPIDDQRLAFYMGDFAGHGVTAAINTFRVQVLIAQQQSLIADPAAFLNHLNAELASHLSLGQFTTMVYGVLDLANRQLRYASAAAPKPLLLSSSPKLLDSEGTPMGVDTDIFEVEEYQVTLPEQGKLVFYSDALIEQKNNSDMFYGRDRLLNLLNSRPADCCCNTLLQLLVEDLKQHAGGSQFADDLTLLAFEFSSR